MMADNVGAIETLHRRALAQLGIIASYLTNATWPATSGSKAPELDGWADYAAVQITELRELARDLTVAYYQLARWAETGYILGQPLDEGSTTVQDLVSSFVARVQAVSDLKDSSTDLGEDIRSALRNRRSKISLAGLDLTSYIEEFEKTVDLPDGDFEIDDFNWPTFSSGDKTLQVIKSRLKSKALEGVDDRLRALHSTEEDSKRLLAKSKEILDNASLTGSGVADELVLEGPRNLATHAHSSDHRVRMYTRGTSGNPCAFCAMLASRGFVYWSATSAMNTYRDGGMNSYHPNCHCFPIVRWSDESKLPEFNEYLQSMWPTITDSYDSATDKLNAWRRWLNEKRRVSRSGNRGSKQSSSQEE